MIHVENLTKTFKIYKKDPGFIGAVKALFNKNFVTKIAVNDISFDISEGEIVGYIGSNGAGKSTTIKIMTGILVPTKGKCTVNGLIPYKDRQKNAKNIGVVFGQRTQLWWDLALGETFRILKEIYEISDTDYKERLEFLSKVLDLDEFIDRPVRTLSLGQKMRGDLAASLLHNPKILFLDEPTLGLDVIARRELWSVIEQLKGKITIILTTHYMEEAESLSDRVGIMSKGNLIEVGTPQELISKVGANNFEEAFVKIATGGKE